MKITGVSGVVFRQQLVLSGPKPKFAGEPRTAFETLLIKVETDAGIVGWGEAFPHRVWQATKSLLETLIAPACIGADPTDISSLMNTLIRRTYGVGRAGPVMYALSGLDIALWDILGKAANLPIHKLLGGASSPKIPAYASLLKYGETSAVVHYCEQAFSRGYTDIKVHEVGYDAISTSAKLARDAKAGPVMVDVNAPWNLQEAVANMAPLRDLGLKWVEEPVWPPEDFRALAVARETGVPVAIGETVLSPTDFARLIECRAADFIQPSVAKIGGISVARDIYAMANQASVAVVPHSAYFGPGLIATAHLTAALSRAPFIERLYVDLTDSPFGDWYVPKNGYLDVPQGPGLGVEPDLKLLEKLRVD
jgi:L-alanine-DL-glutamate epimerase-like enolase superfamily enzyme